MIENRYFKFESLIGHEEISSSQMIAAATWNDQIVLLLLSGSQVGLQAASARLKLKEYLELRGDYTMRGRFECEDGFEMLRSSAETMGQHYGLILNKNLLTVMPGSRTTFVLGPVGVDPHDDPATVSIIGQRIGQIAAISILPEWYGEVVKKARFDNHIFKVNCRGCTVWAVPNNPELFADIVSGLIKSRKISFPVAS